MSGKPYALNTGPDASNLIIVRATHTLDALGTLYAPAGRKGGDSLALLIIRKYTGKQTEVRCYYFPMSTGGAEKEVVWDGVATALVQEAEVGKQVGSITLGDAILFSTWVSLPQHTGCPDRPEIAPGVMSFVAIAAHSKMPLVMGQQSLVVVSYTVPEAEIQQVLRQHDNPILMKMCGRFARIRVLLQQEGLLDCASMTSEATLPGE